MSRIAGVLVLLAAMYAAMFAADPKSAAVSNLLELANQQGFYGVLTLAAAALILSGSIDLSLGSVVALGAVVFVALMKQGVPPYAAVALTVLAGGLIGLAHGLLVSRLKLQSFLVTLCGMFVWRGAARLLAGDREVGVQLVLGTHPEFGPALGQLRLGLVGIDERFLFVFPAMLGVFAVVATLYGLALHGTVHGRYWLALGYSEAAARYAGVPVERYRVASFVVASSLGALAGVLLLLNYGTAKPDNAAVSFELFAITGAVLGGVSLRGGEANVLGIALGAAVLPLLAKLVNFAEVPDQVIPIVVGLTLFAGSVADETVRRRAAGRGSGK